MMNLMSFCFFGLVLETIIGHTRFIMVYLGSLLFSSLVLTVKNANNAYYRALGASGAITGVIFSYILYRPTSKISFMFAPMGVPAPVFALAYVGYSYFMAKNKFDNVAHDAHLWGAISGALITVAVDPNLMGIVNRFYH
jgi:membrane associated rhomboid family serine protease